MAPKLLWRAPGPPPIVVLAEQSRRTLAFGNGTVQTCVDLAAPQRLELPYTRALAAALLLVRDAPLAAPPRSVLLLGLGGGALAHFLLHHFPPMRIHAVDSSADVIEAARRYFELPEGPALRVEHADARETLERTRSAHDLMLVDLFDASGLPPWVRGQAFLRSARDAMRPGAVLAVNFWVDDAGEFLEVMRSARDVFDGRVLALEVPGFRNLVAFALPAGPRRIALAELRRRAHALAARTGIDFQAIVASLADSNLVEAGDLVLVADGARE